MATGERVVAERGGGQCKERVRDAVLAVRSCPVARAPRPKRRVLPGSRRANRPQRVGDDAREAVAIAFRERLDVERRACRVDLVVLSAFRGELVAKRARRARQRNISSTLGIALLCENVSPRPYDLAGSGPMQRLQRVVDRRRGAVRTKRMREAQRFTQLACRLRELAAADRGATEPLEDAHAFEPVADAEGVAQHRARFRGACPRELRITDGGVDQREQGNTRRLQAARGRIGTDGRHDQRRRPRVQVLRQQQGASRSAA